MVASLIIRLGRFVIPAFLVFRFWTVLWSVPGLNSVWPFTLSLSFILRQQLSARVLSSVLTGLSYSSMAKLHLNLQSPFCNIPAIHVCIY